MPSSLSLNSHSTMAIVVRQYCQPRHMIHFVENMHLCATKVYTLVKKREKKQTSHIDVLKKNFHRRQSRMQMPQLSKMREIDMRMICL